MVSDISIDTWVGSIGLVGGVLMLVLSFIVLPKQIHEIRTHKNIGAFRWTLLIINLLAIATAISPLWGAIEILLVGKVSGIVRIASSISVRVFFLAVVIALFLMYTVFNRRKP